MLLDILACPIDKVLLDTSFTCKNYFSIQEALYEGIDGLSGIPIEELSLEIEHINFLKELFSKKIYVIPEVHQELNRGWEILGQQVNYIGRKFGEKRSKKHKDWTQEDEEYALEVYRLLRIYLKNLHSFHGIINAKENNLDLSDELEEYRDSVYNLVLNYSKDLNRNIKKWRLSNPNNLGMKLKTDTKLISTAVTMARNDPITIATRDRDISIMLERVQNRSTYGFPSPKNLVYIWNPYDPEINSYDLSRRKAPVLI